MKIKLKTIVFIVGVLFAIAKTYAQEPEFGVSALSGPDGIHLYIGGDILNKSTAAQTNGWAGYNIYKRAEGNPEFKKLNDRTIARVNTLAELEKKIGSDFKLLLGFSETANNREFWNLIDSRDEKALVLAMIYPPLREALGLSYLDKDVKTGVSYSYVITRIDSRGTESAFSDSSTAIFGTPPLKLHGPRNIRGTVSNNSVRLQWQVNPTDSSAFTYSIYRAFKPEGPFTKLNERPLMIFYLDENEELPYGSFEDTTAKNGRMYYYAVVSVDMAGNESPRQPLQSFVPRDNEPPLIPQKVAAKSAANGIELTWEIIRQDDLAGFVIYRSQIPDSQFTRLDQSLSPRDTGVWIDKSALPNVQYYYKITAVDLSGNESEKSATAFFLFENRKAPLVPNPISAEGTSDGILIKWRPNTETDLLGYYVFRGEGVNDSAVQVSPLINKDTTFYRDKDSRLSPKGTYRYMIKAVNYTGATSGYSYPVMASPGIVILPEPPLSFYGYQDIIGNRLFWIPTSDNIAAGYQIYRAIENDSLEWLKLLSVPLPKNFNNYTDSTASIGVKYLYRIVALDANGNDGKPSQSISLSKFAPPPLPPADVIVSRTETGLLIKWDTTLEPRVKGYNIYRHTGAEKRAKLNQMVLQKSVGEYRDDNVKKGNRYFYSITTVGEDGNEGARSSEAIYMVK